MQSKSDLPARRLGLPVFSVIRILGHGLTVKGKVVDPQIRKLAAISSAFPPDFTKQIELKSPVANFKHRYRDKTLEVVLFKR